jgi:heme-degrading monooxygenase HmoA
MRALAMEQPGYISGETLVNLDHPGEYMVLSTWTTIEQWKSWLADSRRTAIQLEIDALLGSVTEFKIYCHG